MNANKIVHNSMDDLVKKSDVLFTEDATVVHISGNKDSSGRVLKVSQGLQKCFGYNKSEVIGHNVNFLMPNLIGNRHNDLLDKFYKTGRQRVFNVERVVFCHNRQGHCFSSKILVKQMPSLKEGI
jgi:PAS domain S-box-containing protein